MLRIDRITLRLPAEFADGAGAIGSMLAAELIAQAPQDLSNSKTADTHRTEVRHPGSDRALARDVASAIYQTQAPNQGQKGGSA